MVLNDGSVISTIETCCNNVIHIVQLQSNPSFGPTVVNIAEGEGDKGNTDAEQLAAAALAGSERLVQEDIAKQIVDSPMGQEALIEAHAIAQAAARADSDKAFADAKARAQAQAEQAVIDGTAKAKIDAVAQELAKRKKGKWCS